MAEPNKKEDKPFETKVIESLDEFIPSEPHPSKKEDKPFETEKIVSYIVEFKSRSST